MDAINTDEFSAWAVTWLFIMGFTGVVVLTGWGEDMITHWFNMCYVIVMYVAGVI